VIIKARTPVPENGGRGVRAERGLLDAQEFHLHDGREGALVGDVEDRAVAAAFESRELVGHGHVRTVVLDFAGDSDPVRAVVELGLVGAVDEAVARQQWQDREAVMVGRAVDQRALVGVPGVGTFPAGHVRGLAQDGVHIEDVHVADGILSSTGGRVRHLGQRVGLLWDRGDDGQAAALDLAGQVVPVALDYGVLVGLFRGRDDAFPAAEGDGLLGAFEDEGRAEVDVNVALAHLSLGGGGEHDGEQDEGLHGSSETCVLGWFDVDEGAEGLLVRIVAAGGVGGLDVAATVARGVGCAAILRFAEEDRIGEAERFTVCDTHLMVVVTGLALAPRGLGRDGHGEDHRSGETQDPDLLVEDRSADATQDPGLLAEDCSNGALQGPDLLVEHRGADDAQGPKPFSPGHLLGEHTLSYTCSKIELGVWVKPMLARGFNYI
jgi:hypothetical protein